LLSADKLLELGFQQPHANRLYDPLAAADFPRPLLEPRNPPGYALELPPAPFAQPTQVCILRRVLIPLPQAKAAGRDRALRAVTPCVGVFREDTMILGTAVLTLRLFDHDPALVDAVCNAFRDAPERLRVFRRNTVTDAAEPVRLATDALQVLDFARGKGVAFPITRFGTYVVALEQDR
jgi:hypothetical protein